MNGIIDQVAGDDGFSKESTRAMFLKAGDELVTKGFSQQEALTLLSDLYWAVIADEYGAYADMNMEPNYP